MKQLQKVLFFSAIICILWFLYGQLDQIIEYEWKVNWIWFILSIFCLMISLVTGPMGWCFILESLSHKKTYKLKIFYIWTISSIIKYVPGGIWTYISRVSYAKKEGFKTSDIMLSLFLENILLVLSAISLGIPFLLSLSNLPIQPAVIGLIFICLSLSIHPRVLGFLLKIAVKFGKYEGSYKTPGLRVILKLYFYYVFHWIIFSLAFLIFVLSLAPVNHELYLPVMFSNIVAHALGFIIFLIPGGLGVRESTLYFLLSSYFPPSVCTVIAIGSRVWVIIGEIIALLLATCIKYSDSNSKI